MISNIMYLRLSLSFLALICIDKATSFPSQTSQENCHCIPIKNCDTINEFIDRSSDISFITATIKEVICDFDGTVVSVCCPRKFNYKRQAKNLPKLDYIDELSGLNCPPSFGKEYDYDEYIKSHPNDNDEFESKNEDENSLPVYCSPWGNCVRLKFPKDDEPTTQKPFDENHHSFDHDDSHHHGFRIPFFPFYHHHHHNHHYPHHGAHDYHRDEMPDKFTPMPSITKQSNECGILQGSELTNVYPWIVRLAYLNTTSRTVRYRCLGTIISDEHILTAAHCVDKLVNDLRLIYTRIGDDNNYEDFKIIETTIHPNYNEPLFNNDVALLRLAKARNSRISIVKICLPLADNLISVGSTGIVAGWSENGGSSNDSTSTIRYINLPILNNTECAIRYAKYSENFENNIIITPREFCAKAEAMNDVCEGDSGGPFMDRSVSGRYTLMGIVAFGPKTNCGQSNLPGVYMRVSAYLNWIQQNIT